MLQSPESIDRASRALSKCSWSNKSITLLLQQSPSHWWLPPHSGWWLFFMGWGKGERFCGEAGNHEQISVAQRAACEHLLLYLYLDRSLYKPHLFPNSGHQIMALTWFNWRFLPCKRLLREFILNHYLTCLSHLSLYNPSPLSGSLSLDMD